VVREEHHHKVASLMNMLPSKQHGGAKKAHHHSQHAHHRHAHRDIVVQHHSDWDFFTPLDEEDEDDAAIPSDYSVSSSSPEYNDSDMDSDTDDQRTLTKPNGSWSSTGTSMTAMSHCADIIGPVPSSGSSSPVPSIAEENEEDIVFTMSRAGSRHRVARWRQQAKPEDFGMVSWKPSMVMCSLVLGGLAALALDQRRVEGGLFAALFGALGHQLYSKHFDSSHEQKTPSLEENEEAL